MYTVNENRHAGVSTSKGTDEVQKGSAFVERDEPVLVNFERALRVIGTDVRAVGAHEGRPVTVREILVTRCTHNFRNRIQRRGHECKLKHCCDINVDTKSQRDTTKQKFSLNQLATVVNLEVLSQQRNEEQRHGKSHVVRVSEFRSSKCSRRSLHGHVRSDDSLQPTSQEHLASCSLQEGGRGDRRGTFHRGHSERLPPWWWRIRRCHARRDGRSRAGKVRVDRDSGLRRLGRNRSDLFPPVVLSRAEG